MKRIIVEMDVPYWNAGIRKKLMQWIIHNLSDGEENPKGAIIEPLSPYPLIPLSRIDGEKEFPIKWD